MWPGHVIEVTSTTHNTDSLPILPTVEPVYSSQGHLSSPSQPPFGLPDPLAANDTYFRQSESLFPQDDEDSNDPADGQPIGGPSQLHLQPNLEEELEQEIEALGGGSLQ